MPVVSYQAFRAMKSPRPNLVGRAVNSRPNPTTIARAAFRAALAVLPPAAGNPPVVSNLSPASGSGITPFQAISFDITDALAFRLIIVAVYFPGMNAAEIAHDGTAFLPAYSQGSTRLAIANAPGQPNPGFAYSLQRQGGWIGNPVIHTYAVDINGNMNTNP